MGWANALDGDRARGCGLLAICEARHLVPLWDAEAAANVLTNP